MKCDDVGEFMSRLCDGQVIPAETAEHIGVCETCRARMTAYLAMGAELRRLASLEQAKGLRSGIWEKRTGLRTSWWQKGRRTIRVPRYAFAGLLAAILLLSGSLVLVRAHTGADGPLLQLTFKLPDGRTGDCILTTDDNPGTNQCGWTAATQWGGRTMGARTAIELRNGGTIGLKFRFVSKDGDGTQLAAQAAYRSDSNMFDYKDVFKDVPETMVLEPRDGQQITAPGFGDIELTGRYLNRIPVRNLRPIETLDPRWDEFRVVEPVLIRGNQVICDLSNSGISADDGDPDATLMIYYPGEGRYLISRMPFQRAVEGTVSFGQIRFNLDGEDYLLLAAMPTVRSEHVWVSHDASYKISEHVEGAKDDRPMFAVRSLSILLRDKMNRWLD